MNVHGHQLDSRKKKLNVAYTPDQRHQVILCRVNNDRESESRMVIQTE